MGRGSAHLASEEEIVLHERPTKHDISLPGRREYPTLSDVAPGNCTETRLPFYPSQAAAAAEHDAGERCEAARRKPFAYIVDRYL